MLSHANQNLKGLSIFWFSDAPLFHKGGFAVECFFVLSGFLLTYLAVYEYKQKGKINFKSFYLRRIFRIFPLYYLAVFLGYITLGFLYPILLKENYLTFSITEGLFYHIFFLPNLMIAKYPEQVGSLYSLWSIGVEEQFYIFFPFLIAYLLRKRKLLMWLFLVLFGYYSAYLIIQKINPFCLDITPHYFLFTLKFHFMFIGAIFAILYIKYHNIFMEVLSKSIVKIIFFALFFTIYIYKFYC